MIQMNLFTKQKQTHSLREGTHGYWGKLWGRDSQGVWDGHVHTVVFKMDNQQGPTVSSGMLFNVMWQAGWEEGLGKNGYMHTHG